MLARSRHSSNS